MLFHSLAFAGFLAVVLPLYYMLAHRWQNRLLLVASYVFYAAWDWRFLSLLFLQTAVDYLAALGMERAAGRPARRRLFLWLSLGVNLGVLGVFKYYDFFAESLAGLAAVFGWRLSMVPLRLILPAGISFYTFQTMAYTIDVYRGRQVATRDFLAFALYVSYFPHLVAGPIMRAGHLLPQIQRPRVVTAPMISSAAQLLLLGYLKKVGIADAVAPYVERAFTHPASAPSLMLLMGVYLFAIQIYCDFSGYTDIARGVSRLFGIELTVNFCQPYLSGSITEFWRHWHISLSTWLRDYLYIPLGGNRLGPVKTYRNLMVTMLLGGLWHGAAWTFVIWGGLHGLYLSVEKFFAGGRAVEAAPAHEGAWGWVRRAGAVLATFHLVCLAWIFFRAPSLGAGWAYLSGLFANRAGWGREGWLWLAASAFYLALVLLIDLACRERDREFPLSAGLPAWGRGLAYASAVLMISFVGGSRVVPFIYFQF
jgi:alginate O-acetyltransferase complex protein AlgI